MSYHAAAPLETTALLSIFFCRSFGCLGSFGFPIYRDFISGLLNFFSLEFEHISAKRNFSIELSTPSYLDDELFEPAITYMWPEIVQALANNLATFTSGISSHPSSAMLYRDTLFSFGPHIIKTWFSEGLV